jgi:hypothetical protein
VLSKAPFNDEVKCYFYSATRYPNIKEFLNDLSQELSNEAKVTYNPSRVINTLLLNIQLSLDKINTFR